MDKSLHPFELQASRLKNKCAAWTMVSEFSSSSKNSRESGRAVHTQVLMADTSQEDLPLHMTPEETLTQRDKALM